MNIPDNLYYSKDHEWTLIENDTATVGITAHAAEQLGDITFVELPEIGAKISQGDELAVVESIKAASDIFAPVGGTVKEINTELDDAPEKINSDPYGEGWICKISGVDDSEVNDLMNAEEYAAFLNED
jgi:glycine cleavage system H protein